jgi:tetratricopeptide (TPR) repeat protein
LRVFDGCSDVRLVEVPGLDELDRRAELAWAEDRALRLFLFLLDPGEPEDELTEYAECVAELLGSHSILLPLKQRLAAAPLPSLVEVTRVEEACATVDPVRELFQWLLSIQGYVARVHEAFEAVPITSFGGEQERRKLRSQLVEEGSFFDAVTELSANKDLTFLRLKVASQHRALAAAISQWFEALQGGLKRLSRSEIRSQEAEPIEEYENFDADARQPSYAAFNSVMVQQRAIVAKIKERDLDRARRLMSDLVAAQQLNSTPEQIAKSLSSMAQQAKRHDVPDLALEWSREATVANSLDPIAFGHLANALIDIGSYAEAEGALNAVEQNGDLLFAATGRARILRDLGRVNEARDAFVAVVRTFEGVPAVVHAQLGAAEALRELGDVHGALAEYRRLANFSPEEASVWAGLASTLVDLGLIEEALQTYSKAATYDSLVARTGRAHAYRVIGNLAAALTIYDEVLADFPSNYIALCGRGDVLQDQGNLDLALVAYEQAIERSPYRPEPVAGKASVLRHMGRFDEALVVNEEARDRFRSDRRFPAGIIAIYRAQGRYSEALVALDKLNAEFPFDTRGRVARAAILSRLGSADEAMAAYEAILAERPQQLAATLGKAALLIRLGRNSEALELLPARDPKTRSDWRRLTLRAVLMEAKEGYRAASKMLSRFIPLCPFAFERRRMRDLLATIELRWNHWTEARRVVDSNPDEVSNVISLHVLAATHRPGRARDYLARIRASNGPADIVDLANEIARRHQLTEEAPRHPEGWIETTERNILLADAA